MGKHLQTVAAMACMKSLLMVFNFIFWDGLPGLIEFKHEHNHSETSESLSYLRPTKSIKDMFEVYFNDGLGVKEAINLHESKLELEEGENSVTIACASMNPPKHTVYDWYQKWRSANLGPRTGPGIIEVSGIATLAIGIWMEVKLYKYMKMSTEFSDTAPYVLIGIGSLIILIGSFACCCTVKGQPVLLYVYGAFLAIVFVMELGAGISIFAYRAKLTEGFDKGLTQAMMNYNNDSAHLAPDLDLMQEKFRCCGNHKSGDWLDLIPPQPIPESCCIEENCNTADDNEIYTQGCYDKVIEFLDGNIGVIAGAAVGIAIFPLIGVVLSCCLASVVNKAKYEQMA